MFLFALSSITVALHLFDLAVDLELCTLKQVPVTQGSLKGLLMQGSTLRPVGSPMRLDLVRWRLTFLVWSPVWPPQFQVIILFLFIFSFPKIHHEMSEC